jgi:hypothetical protein
VPGPPQLNTDGSPALDILPSMAPELLGETPSAPKHLVFGPTANAAALGAFSFHVDQITLGASARSRSAMTAPGTGRSTPRPRSP